jgi:hypothetical protein
MLSMLERNISVAGRQTLKTIEFSTNAFHDLLLKTDATSKTDQLSDSLKAHILSECLDFLFFSQDATSIKLDILLNFLDQAAQHSKQFTTSHSDDIFRNIINSYKNSAPKSYPKQFLKDICDLFINIASCKADKPPTPYFNRIFSFGKAVGLYHEMQRQFKELEPFLIDSDTTTLKGMLDLAQKEIAALQDPPYSLPKYFPETNYETMKQPLHEMENEPYKFTPFLFTYLLKAMWGSGIQKETATSYLRTYFKKDTPFKNGSELREIQLLIRDFIFRTAHTTGPRGLSSFELDRLYEHLHAYVVRRDSRNGLIQLHGARIMETMLYTYATAQSVRAQELLSTIEITRGSEGFAGWLTAMEDFCIGSNRKLEMILTDHHSETAYKEAIGAIFISLKQT